MSPGELTRRVFYTGPRATKRHRQCRRRSARAGDFALEPLNSIRPPTRIGSVPPHMNLMTLCMEGSRANFLSLVAIVACLLGVPCSAADTKIYLEMNGIPADATDRGYEKQIAVVSYNVTLAPAGGGSMTLTKNVDSSSPYWLCSQRQPRLSSAPSYAWLRPPLLSPIRRSPSICVTSLSRAFRSAGTPRVGFHSRPCR
jgi:hypothetical protein